MSIQGRSSPERRLRSGEPSLFVVLALSTRAADEAILWIETEHTHVLGPSGASCETKVPTNPFLIRLGGDILQAAAIKLKRIQIGGDVEAKVLSYSLLIRIG